MIIRGILTVVLIVACFVVISVIEQSVAPNTSADLAINQLKEDGSREQLRILENSQNWLDTVCYLGTESLLLWVWYKPIKNKINTRKVEIIDVKNNHNV